MKKIILLLMMFVLTLAGCSSSETTTEAEMVPYESVNGEVMIPANPQRIVTDYYVGQLLSIGAPIVGGDLTYSSPAWEGHLDGVSDIGQSVEAVAALEPDLIITAYPDSYDQYAAIAPTIVIPYGTFNEEEIITELGIITNREDEAEQVLVDYNKEVEELAKLIDNPELTYSIIEFSMADPYIYGNNFGRLGYTIYEKLGLNCTVACEENILSDPNSYLMLTQENIAEYVGDVLILSSPNAEPVDNAITQSESFKATSAYENDRIYYVDSNLFYFTDPLSVHEQMKVFEEILQDEEI